MNAIHVNWTKPFGEGDYCLEDFEILTTILSALEWRKYNGKIKLVADKRAIDFYKKTGIDCIWDSIEELYVDDSINPKTFWAAGKLFALQKENAPVAIIDTDFIVWKKIDFDSLDDCTVIHFEDLYPDVYPVRDFFQMKDGYKWKNYNWKLEATNTAFAIFKSKELIEKYTESAIEFMKYAKETDDYLCYMVFCEQRLLHMVAHSMNIKISQLMECDELFAEKNQTYTHIWGMKQQMRDFNDLRVDFCKKCIRRIVTDFPDVESVIKNIEILKKYF